MCCHEQVHAITAALTLQETSQRWCLDLRRARSTAFGHLRRKLQAASYTAGGRDAGRLFRHYDRDNTGSLSLDDFTRCAGLSQFC